jgi:hypothetical protein
MFARSKSARLAHLERLAKRKAKAMRGFLIYPRRALAITASSPVKYANEYFRSLTVAPFFGPLARDYDFESEVPLEVRISRRSGSDLVDTINNKLYDLHLYLSNFLTHPRYGPEKQIAFGRGDTLRPVELTEVAPGRYAFRVRGIVVGVRDLLHHLKGQNLDGPPAPAMRPVRPGWQRIVVCMPTRPDATEVGDAEWYDFKPHTWKRRHPTIPLMQIPIRLRPREERTVVAPKYDLLYRDGLLRVAFLFGYDDEGHETSGDARWIWKILTAPPDRTFTKHETGDFGYHGPGLCFDDPTGGDFKKLNLDGTTVFRRGWDIGGGPLTVRYQLAHAPLYVGGREAPRGHRLRESKAGARWSHGAEGRGDRPKDRGRGTALEFRQVVGPDHRQTPRAVRLCVPRRGPHPLRWARQLRRRVLRRQATE